jgi:hypothetical protein
VNRADRRREAKQARRRKAPEAAMLVRNLKTGRVYITGRATGLGARLFEGMYARAANRFLTERRAIEDARAELLARPDL